MVTLAPWSRHHCHIISVSISIRFTHSFIHFLACCQWNLTVGDAVKPFRLENESSVNLPVETKSSEPKWIFERETEDKLNRFSSVHLTAVTWTNAKRSAYVSAFSALNWRNLTAWQSQLLFELQLILRTLHATERQCTCLGHCNFSKKKLNLTRLVQWSNRRATSCKVW